MGSPVAARSGLCRRSRARRRAAPEAVTRAIARQTAGDLPHALNNVLGHVALVLLLLAVIGLYAHQSEAAGRLRLIGFLRRANLTREDHHQPASTR